MIAKLYRLVSPFFPLFVLAFLAGVGLQMTPTWNAIGTGVVIFGAFYSLSRFQEFNLRTKMIVQSLWVVSLFVQFLILMSSQAAFAFNSDDPRLGIKSVRKCVEIVESGLDLDQFDSETKETEIIKACREADAACVSTVLGHLPSLEKTTRSQTLPIVRECKLGVGGCFEMQIEKMSSIDYADAKKALKVLKKCD